MKNISVFFSENFQFLEVKFSIYLNRRVFVMSTLLRGLDTHGIYSDYAAAPTNVRLKLSCFTWGRKLYEYLRQNFGKPCVLKNAIFA